MEYLHAIPSGKSLEALHKAFMKTNIFADFPKLRGKINEKVRINWWNEYYRSIEYGVQKKSGQNFFPNITIESLNVFEVLNLCKKQDYDGLTDYLLNGINQLSAAGVQYAALTGITTHIVFDAL